MASPPEAHSRSPRGPRGGNSAHGDVYGQLLQVRDIHGGVTLNAPPQAPPQALDVSLDPPRPATAVRGREELLGTLRQAMERGAPVPHVLTGPGGFGKTTVAAAMAEHACSEGWTVFWVRPDAILPSMLEVAVELGGSRQEADQFKAAPRRAARWVWRHLDAAPRPWLLVIDNADRPEELDPENRPGEQRGWMRSSPGGFVLVTSRLDDPALWAPAKVHRVKALESADATTVLADHAGAAELPGADELAERLGGVPLALYLAGRILATHRVLFPDANSLLERVREDISKLDELATPVARADDSERRTLSGVWNLSLHMVGQQNPRAVSLLRVLALLGSQGQEVPLRRLPVAALRGGALDSPSSPLDEVSLVRAVNALVVHGLVTVGISRGESVLKLHPLVAETTRTNITREEVHLLDEVAALLSLQRGHDPLLELTAHYCLVAQRKRHAPSDHESLIRACETLEWHIIEQRGEILRSLFLTGHYEEAEELGRGSVSNSIRDLGPTDTTTLRYRHQLAEVWLERGKVAEAEAEYRELVELNTTHHGSEHDNTLDAKFMLALIALRREEWDEARAEFRAVWEVGERVHGPEDRRVLLTRENLAYAVMRQGDLDAAEQEFAEVRAIRARTLGEHHTLTAQADFYLGRVAFEAGDHERAQKPFARCLSVQERALGVEHPDTENARKWLERVTHSM